MSTMLQVEVLEGAHVLLRRPLGKYDNVLVGPSADAEVQTDRVASMIPMIRASPGGKGWELVYPPSTAGHVMDGVRSRSLAECAKDPSARTDGELAVFPLPAGAIGGIELGELRIRFREVPDADATTVLPRTSDESAPAAIGVGVVALLFVLIALVFPHRGGTGVGGTVQIVRGSPTATRTPGAIARGTGSAYADATPEPVPSEHRELPYATELPMDTPEIVEPTPASTAVAIASPTAAPIGVATAVASASPAPSGMAATSATPAPSGTVLASTSPTPSGARTPIASASPTPSAARTAVAGASPTPSGARTPIASASPTPTGAKATPTLVAKVTPTPRPSSTGSVASATPSPGATPKEHDPLALAVASPKGTPRPKASPARTPPPSGFLGDPPQSDEHFDERLDALPTMTPSKTAFTLEGGDSALTGVIGGGLGHAGATVRGGGQGSVGDIEVGPAGTGDMKIASAGKVETPVEGKLQPSAPKVSGTIDADRVAAVVQEASSAFRACYEAGLRRNTRISGKIVLTWRIVEDGAVEEIRTGSSTLRDAEVERCLMTRVRRLRFPRPDGGTVSVEYPMAFYAAVDTN